MTSIGPLQLQTFSLALALAILLSAAVALRQRPGPPGAVIDVCLLALVTGLLAARSGHILLHAAHFSVVPEDIWRLGSGGLEWHSALAGALGGLWLGARWRRVDRRALLDSLAPALALLTLGAWRGCAAAGCAYGREVDTLANHSALLVAELPDIYAIHAPRYNTPLMGLLLALAAAASDGPALPPRLAARTPLLADPAAAGRRHVPHRLPARGQRAPPGQGCAATSGWTWQ